MVTGGESEQHLIIFEITPTTMMATFLIIIRIRIRITILFFFVNCLAKAVIEVHGASVRLELLHHLFEFH